MKAWLYYTVFENVDAPIPDSFIHGLPASMADEIRLYKKQDDINRLTAGKHLLKRMITDLGYPISIFENYAIDPMGKPFIPDFLPFNISHSGSVVACTVLEGNGKIGIDVEKVRKIEITKFDKQFSPPEMMQILGASDPNQKFFEYWTMKESVMKADGRGMRIPLHSIRLKGDHATIDDSEIKWNVYPVELDTSVKGHVCSDEKISEIGLKGFSIGKLFY